MMRMVVPVALIAAWGVAAWAEDKTAEEKTTEGMTTAEATEASEAADAVSAEVDLEAAEKIFRKSCRACHGNKAQGAASYPSLVDKTPEHIVEMLERYRSGERIGPNSILMIQHAKKLSDEDIASLSVYITTAFD